MCVFSAAKPPKKHTLVLFEAAGGGLKKNILFRTRYLPLKTWLALFGQSNFSLASFFK